MSPYRRLAAALATVAVLTACEADRSASPRPSGTSPSVAVTTSQAENAVRLDAVDYGYTQGGTARAGLARITFANTGRDLHMASFARLNDGKTASDVTAALGTDDEADDKAVFTDPDGSVDGNPGILTPGATTTTYARLEEGTYAIVCFFPATDGAPHWSKGMVATLAVGAAAGEVPAPATAGEITTDDTALNVPALTSGKGTFHYLNTGRRTHALLFVALADDRTYDDFITWADAYFAGKARLEDRPGEIRGGLEAVAKEAFVTLDLPPGRYVALDTESADAAKEKTEFYRDEFGGLRTEFTVT